MTEINVNIVIVDIQMLVTDIPDEIGMRITFKCNDCLNEYNIDEYDNEVAKDIEDSIHKNMLPTKRDITCPKCNPKTYLN